VVAAVAFTLPELLLKKVGGEPLGASAYSYVLLSLRPAWTAF